ncbi:MAG: hypothetical protein IKG46_04095 [Solobacterium sp.]|nr:hypothetical protein [Solobacterium sp.]
MYYHASGTGGIKILKPEMSEHGKPLVYFSERRENVLVYLSNAVEKYCRETGFQYAGKYSKWGPYGFDRDGILQLEEYYPNALESTYKGVSGYIYSADSITEAETVIGIPNTAVSSQPVETDNEEYVPDAYEAILQAERSGLICIVRYDRLSEKKKEWIGRTIRKEYEEALDHPEYRHFLKGKFPDILKG